MRPGARPVTGSGALFAAVFLASVVEAVEAATIVLAAGTTRQWRSTLTGVGAGLLSLGAVVAILGPAVSALPIWILRVVVGWLLLVFGLQWLRKSILRAAGYKALHDEQMIFRSQVEAAGAAELEQRGLVRDWYAFTLAFKGVFLEGLEVVFIVLTFGANTGNVPLATLAAVLAVALVTIIVIVVRAPLARVPENGMKFVVGVMLTAFGTFWSVEGAGAQWPGADAALLVLVPAIALFGGLTIIWLSRLESRRRGRPELVDR
jgi:uncharacterized membrane protein